MLDNVTHSLQRKTGCVRITHILFFFASNIWQLRFLKKKGGGELGIEMFYESH